VSTRENLRLVQEFFKVEYVLDPISMRWIHDYETPEGLQAAQDYLFGMNFNANEVL
jgi:hypothetical protein